MKLRKFTTIAYTLAILLLLVPAASYAKVLQPDYIAKSNTIITNARTDISAFIQRYQTGKSTFSAIQSEQIESQYNSIEHAMDTISSNEKKDSGTNLQNDFYSLQNLNIETVKMPLLNSELFTFKSEYILTLLSQYNVEYASIIVNSVSSSNHQEALNDAENITKLLNNAQTDDANIKGDYSNLADEEALTNNAATQTSMRNTLLDIKKSQQQILNDINGIISSINELNSF